MLYLANNLIKLGHEVFIFCPGNNLLIEKEENIIKIPGIEVKKFYGYKIAQPIHPLIQKEVDDLHLDIIHAETEFGVGTLANIVAFNLNIPRVRTYHTDYVDYTHYFVPEELGPIYDGAKRIVTLYNKFYGDHCLRLMTPSEKTKKGLLKAGIKTKIDVVPNGIELDRFNISNTSTNGIKSIKDKYQIKIDDKLFVYVGRLADEKRVDFLINVFNKDVLSLSFDLLNISNENCKVSLFSPAGNLPIKPLILPKSIFPDFFIAFKSNPKSFNE